jgi:chemotaxis signal transduction protein
MKDLIVFSVKENRYALDIALIQRIIQVPDVTVIPDAHKAIDGMISYEGEVTKVLNFRKLIHMPSYKEEIEQLFTKLHNDHKVWVESLSQSVIENSEFPLTLDPHACELGCWLDAFNTHDEHIASLLKDLKKKHSRLHGLGGELLGQRQKDETGAIERLQGELNDLYSMTSEAIRKFSGAADDIADSLQKLLIYQGDGEIFAIRIDSIDDISRIDADQLQHSDQPDMDGYLEIEGVLEHEGKLINIIKSVTLPRNEV